MKITLASHFLRGEQFLYLQIWLSYPILNPFENALRASVGKKQAHNFRIPTNTLGESQIDSKSTEFKANPNISRSDI